MLSMERRRLRRREKLCKLQRERAQCDYFNVETFYDLLSFVLFKFCSKELKKLNAKIIHGFDTIKKGEFADLLRDDCIFLSSCSISCSQRSAKMIFAISAAFVIVFMTPKPIHIIARKSTACFNANVQAVKSTRPPS